MPGMERKGISSEGWILDCQLDMKALVIVLGVAHSIHHQWLVPPERSAVAPLFQKSTNISVTTNR